MTGGMRIYLGWACFLIAIVIISIMARRRAADRQKSEEEGAKRGTSIRLVLSRENYSLLKAGSTAYGVGVESFVVQSAMDKASSVIEFYKTEGKDEASSDPRAPKELQKAFQANFVDLWRADVITDDWGQLIRLPKNLHIACSQVWFEVRSDETLVLHPHPGTTSTNGNIFESMCATAHEESITGFTDLFTAGREEKVGKLPVDEESVLETD